MESDKSLPLERQLRQEILRARERVYHFGSSTPLERLELAGVDLWVKREDLSPIKAYKWRGACNRMAVLSASEKQHGVVTASAGNHAQGVALAAKHLQLPARIYMPRSTPGVKQDAVLRLGDTRVEVELAGDSYDEAVSAARQHEQQTGAVYIHAYDDLQVMAGQGTLADEVVLSGKGPFDVAYLQIGGGGLAAGVSEWLRAYWPEMEIVGVEGEGQACLQAALAAGQPTQLTQLDIFCDGTAVRQVGALPFEVCQRTLDRVVTVSNDEVIHAIRQMWEGLRCVCEPSGAMGLAAALQEQQQLSGKRVLVILCGANIDFLQLGHIASSPGASRSHSRSVSVCIPERPGTMLQLLDSAFSGLNITDFQYGKTGSENAWPVFSLSAASPQQLSDLPAQLEAAGFAWKDLNGAPDVAFRAIPLRSDLLQFPLFLKLEFYERQGALHDFLQQLGSGHTGLCYFNYRQTGERIGRALLGIDFNSANQRQDFAGNFPPQGEGYRLCEALDAETADRLQGRV
ncbi:MAG: pyridoxal-phosphate dependent enzyme [Verrucomicrobiota bacterium]